MTRRSVDIRDVPCVSCQHGYLVRHRCEMPDYCPCDHDSLHLTEDQP